MSGLDAVAKVDADLRACMLQRERALNQLVEALIAVMTCDNRIDVLLTRRTAAELEVSPYR